jgi:hypothetical protein
MRFARTLRLTVPKSSRAPGEANEDALMHVIRRRYAVFATADGASQTIFAATWAEFLVAALCAVDFERIRAAADEQIARDAFLRGPVQQAAEQFRRHLPSHLPWYVELGLERGVAATLLVVIVLRRERLLVALAIGDCCLAVWSESNGHVHRFPYEAVDSLPRRPWAVVFRLDRADADVPTPRFLQRPFALDRDMPAGQSSGRLFLALMTDALAEWFLRAYAAGERPHEELARLRRRTFARWVSRQRAAGQLRDDDTTLLLARVSWDKVGP